MTPRAELARILDAVGATRRHSGAHVRILNHGTLSSIRSALIEDSYHVLHISCHAASGELLLEDEQGGIDSVTTERYRFT